MTPMPQENTAPMPSEASRQPLPLLTLAFRPFFLGAGLWSAAALALWIVMLARGGVVPIRFDPLDWHIHEMLFGFVLAAIAGFLLTAIPNWTGRPPIHGIPLACLVILWVVGRAVGLVGAFIPLWLGAAFDVAFPIALCAIAAREIILAGNRRNMPIPVPVAVLAVADLLMFLQAAGYSVPDGLGWRLGLAAIIILISVIGGRIIPAFTHNWLVKRGDRSLPPAHNAIDSAALGLLHAGLIGWVFLPGFKLVGGLLLLAAAANLLRLSCWRGRATWAEPLLLSLHIGYLWVAVGSALLGASILFPAFPEAAAIHAWTAGAIGTMILAVMTRVSLGHTGRPLEADRITAIVYLMVTLSALTRIVAAFSGAATMGLLDASAGLWIASFLLFVARYGNMLLRPRYVSNA